MDNVRIETFRIYYNEGHWTLEMLDKLKEIGYISPSEYKEILKAPKEIKKDPRVGEPEYTAEIWDRKTPINGASPEYFLNDPTFKNASNIFIVKNNYSGKVDYVENIDIIRGNERLRTTLTDEEVMEYYLEQLINSKQEQPLIRGDFLEANRIYKDAINEMTNKIIIDRLDKIIKLLEGK